MLTTHGAWMVIDCITIHECAARNNPQLMDVVDVLVYENTSLQRAGKRHSKISPR